jgi:hypothetical protein
MIMAFTPDEIVGGIFDNTKGSAWPALIQYGLLGRTQGTVDNPLQNSTAADWPNMVNAGSKGAYNHMTEPNENLHYVLELLWRAAEGTGKAKTQKIKQEGDHPDFNWVDTIVDKTRDQNTPCLVSIGKDNTGPFNSETVYTIKSREKGWVEARNAADPYGEKKYLLLGTPDIARYAALITWIEGEKKPN